MELPPEIWTIVWQKYRYDWMLFFAAKKKPLNKELRRWTRTLADVPEANAISVRNGRLTYNWPYIDTLGKLVVRSRLWLTKSFGNRYEAMIFYDSWVRMHKKNEPMIRYVDMTCQQVIQAFEKMDQKN